jgi:hypothetical protein
MVRFGTVIATVGGRDKPNDRVVRGHSAKCGGGTRCDAAAE